MKCNCCEIVTRYEYPDFMNGVGIKPMGDLCEYCYHLLKGLPLILEPFRRQGQGKVPARSNGRMFSDEQERQVVAATERMSYREVAKLFGISIGSISAIKRRVINNE